MGANMTNNAIITSFFVISLFLSSWFFPCGGVVTRRPTDTIYTFYMFYTAKIIPLPARRDASPYRGIGSSMISRKRSMSAIVKPHSRTYATSLSLSVLPGAEPNVLFTILLKLRAERMPEVE